MSLPDSIQNIINDLEYLKLEINSLRNLIEEIPYRDKPLGGSSVLELLLKVDQLQKNCLATLKSIGSEDVSASIEQSYTDIELSEEELKEINVSSIFEGILNNRRELIDLISDKSEAYFEVELNDDQTIVELLSETVQKERSMLKSIGELVMTYQTEKQFQREIASRK